jgi:hypothetical protein
LYEDQAEFLTQQGLVQSPILGIWYRHLENRGLLLVLLFADDFLTACTDPVAHNEFRTALQSRFQVQTQPRANWYLQAHIQQDAQGNITINQTRYSMAIWQRYIPNADTEPTAADLRRYRQPVPADYKWKKDDNAATMEESQLMVKEFGFSFIEVVGSLNYLANSTAICNQKSVQVYAYAWSTTLPSFTAPSAPHPMLSHATVHILQGCYHIVTCNIAP